MSPTPEGAFLACPPFGSMITAQYARYRPPWDDFRRQFFFFLWQILILGDGRLNKRDRGGGGGGRGAGRFNMCAETIDP